MKTIVLGGLLIVALLLVACSSGNKEQVLTREEAGVPEPSARVVTVNSREPVLEESSPAVESNIVDDEIAALVNKGKAQTNYKYSFASRIRNRFGNYDESTKFDLYYKEGLAKKVYFNPQRKDANVFYTEVYINFADKTALGVCNSATVLCGASENKAFPLEYDEERPLVLLHLLEGIGSDARKVRTAPFDKRTVMVVEYNNWQGKREQLSIDTYFGLPLQQEVFIAQGDEQISEKRYTFSSLIVGSIKNKDVTLPGNYVLQQ